MDTGLPTRTLGRTGLEVTTLGYGAMSLDNRFGREISAKEARTILTAVLDAGINLIDTSPDYGPSEEMIGASIAGRRDEYILATKVGCPVAVETPRGERPQHVYTRENIRAAIEQSLRRMNTDHLDIVQFHGSPSAAQLEEHGAIEELREQQQTGTIRFIGMSGTIPNLAPQIQLGVFDEFQIPYSALQLEHEELIADAAAEGAGTVIRGGVARGGPAEDKRWDVRRLPEVDPERPRAVWERAGIDELLEGMNRMEFMLRFTLTSPDVHSTIVGTADPRHLAANVEAARRGPLPEDLWREAKRRLVAAGA